MTRLLARTGAGRPILRLLLGLVALLVPTLAGAQDPCRAMPIADAGDDLVSCVRAQTPANIVVSGVASISNPANGPINSFCWTTDAGFFVENGRADYCSPNASATLRMVPTAGRLVANVRLTVRDFAGCSDTDDVVVTLDTNPVIQRAAASVSTQCIGQAFDLVGLAVDTFSTTGLLTYRWDVDTAVDTDGNGLPDDDVDASVSGVSGQLAFASATPTVAGSRTARLSVTGSASPCSVSADVALTVVQTPRIVSVSAPPVTCPNEAVTFRADVLPAPPSSVVTWDFNTSVDADGNGNPADDVQATGSSVSWTFGTGGRRTVRASAAAAAGCATTKDVTIDAYPLPVAEFVSETASCTAMLLTFRDASSAVAPYTITWAFGDGSAAATGSMRTHFFPAPGAYRVTETIRDANACTASVTHVVVVRDAVLQLAGVSILDGEPGTGTTGNSDGFADPGERVRIVLDVENVGLSVPTPVTARATIVTATRGVTLVTDTAHVPPVAPGEVESSAAPHLEVQLASDAPCGTTLLFDVTLTNSDDPSCAAAAHFSLGIGSPEIARAGDELRNVTAAGPSDQPASVFALDAHATVFRDAPFGGSDVFLVRHLPTGQVIDAPQLVADATVTASRPRVAYDPSGDQLGLVFGDSFGEAATTRFQRMSRTGAALGATRTLGSFVSSGSADVAWGGGFFLVAWPEIRGTFTSAVFAQAIGTGGDLLTPVLRVSDADDDGALSHDHVRLAAGSSTWAAAFTRRATTVTRLEVDLFPVGTPSALVPIASANLGASADEAPAVVALGNGYLVAHASPSGIVQLTLLDASGAVVSQQPLAPGDEPSLAANDQLAVVAWTVDHEILAQGVTRGGRPFGAPIALSGGEASAVTPTVSSAPDGSFVVAWREARAAHAANPDLYTVVLRPASEGTCGAVTLGDLAPSPAGDNSVNVGDVVFALRLTVGLETLTDEALARGDVAPGERLGTIHRVIGDGRIDIGDVVVLLQAAVGLITLTR